MLLQQKQMVMVSTVSRVRQPRLATETPWTSGTASCKNVAQLCACMRWTETQKTVQAAASHLLATGGTETAPTRASAPRASAHRG
jgi:hypothetical protein